MQRRSVDWLGVAVTVMRGLVAGAMIAAVEVSAWRFNNPWILAWWLLVPLICPVEYETITELEKEEMANDIVDAVCDVLIEELQKAKDDTESNL